MEPVGLQPCSQEPTYVTYFEQNESSSHFLAPFL